MSFGISFDGSAVTPAAHDVPPAPPPPLPPEALAAIQLLSSHYEAKLGLESSEKFAADMKPPEYLIDGICKRAYVYSMTGKTGDGKTALLMQLTACVSLGMERFGDAEIQGGKVLYLAGENPDDIRARWIALSETMKFDPKNANALFRPGVFDIKAALADLHEYMQYNDEVVLVVVDTAAAFFAGSDENDNKQLGDFARMLREITQMRGKPTVIIAAHPTKNATEDNLIPRGGSAFLGEVDGNLTVVKKGETGIIKMHWQGKHRGPNFDPMLFQLKEVRPERLRDAKGRAIPSVIAEPLSYTVASTNEDNGSRQRIADENTLLRAIRSGGGKLSLNQLAEACGWFLLEKDANGQPIPGKFKLDANGQPITNKTKAQRLVDGLANPKATGGGGKPLIEKVRDGQKITPAGYEVLKQLDALAESEPVARSMVFPESET